MRTSARTRYAGYRFPAEIIGHAVWLYFRFPLGLRMGEELLAARGIIVSHETVRQWARKFGPGGAEADRALRHQPPESGDFYISKAGVFACAVYRRRSADASAWVTYPDEQAHYAPARWVQRQVEETGKPVALRASSMLMHLEAIRAGTGRGVLPCYVGDGHPLLERLTPPIPE